MTATTIRKTTIIRFVVRATIWLSFGWFAVVAIMMPIVGLRSWTEIVSDHADFPKELQTILDVFPATRATYHRLRTGFDFSMTKRGVLRIDGRENVDRFIETAKLEVANGSHPKRKEFDASLIMIDSCGAVDGDLWFASPGFGTIHQEVVDLYLLKTSEDRQTAIAFHYWTF